MDANEVKTCIPYVCAYGQTFENLQISAAPVTNFRGGKFSIACVCVCMCKQSLGGGGGGEGSDGGQIS